MSDEDDPELRPIHNESIILLTKIKNMSCNKLIIPEEVCRGVLVDSDLFSNAMVQIGLEYCSLYYNNDEKEGYGFKEGGVSKYIFAVL